MKITVFQILLAASILILFPLTVFALPINQVSPGTLTGTGLVDFEDVAVGPYNSIVVSGGVSFAERFVGQTLTYGGWAGYSDIISGTPTGPLTLQPGLPGQNLDIIIYGGSNTLNGLGYLGYPDYNAIGEGSFAALFTYNQSEIGFDVLGSNSGAGYVDFFRRDGSLIYSSTINSLENTSYAFQRDGGISDIAGIVAYNFNSGGVTFDNLVYDVTVDPIPEPGTLLLLGTGLAGIAGYGKLRLKRKKKA